MRDNWVMGKEESYGFLGQFLSNKIKECKDYQRRSPPEFFQL